jgi:hypothetical protein
VSQPNQAITELLELANHYPSPHNGQPIRLKQINGTAFDLYFDKARGLQSSDISLIFSFVSVGVFVEHFALCAQALGHDLVHSLDLPKEDAMKGTGVIKIGQLILNWNAKPRDTMLEKLLLLRQTSRKNYFQGPTEALSQTITKIASDAEMTLAQLNDTQRLHAIWLNQRAVFDDMQDKEVRLELDHWLRYTKQQKYDAKDGLAYDCLELNGRLLRYIVHHPALLRLPGVSGILRQYYMRTMKDKSAVFYMLAPFASAYESSEVGKVIMKIWHAVTLEGYYLHPFGTIMSNHAAHQDFLRMAKITNESREHSYLVFIFRCGKSHIPFSFLIIPINKHLILE